MYIYIYTYTCSVSICTVPVKRVKRVPAERQGRARRAALCLFHFGHIDGGELPETCLVVAPAEAQQRQYSYVCTSKASKLSA